MKLLCMIAVFLCIPWVASDAQKQDWGNLKRYAEANKELVRKGKQKDRVVHANIRTGESSNVTTSPFLLV